MIQANFDYTCLSISPAMILSITLPAITRQRFEVWDGKAVCS